MMCNNFYIQTYIYIYRSSVGLVEYKSLTINTVTVKVNCGNVNVGTSPNKVL